MTVAADLVTRFCELLDAGMQSWEEAGRTIVELEASSPSFRAQLQSARPFVTDAVIDAFLRIGRREIHPLVFMDPSKGAKRLASLPYDQQQKVYKHGVTVASLKQDVIITTRKHVSELDKDECARVFDAGRVRTVEQQQAMLHKPRTSLKIANAVSPLPKALPPLPPSKPVQPPAPAKELPDLRPNLAEHLEQAQASLTRAREVLMAIKQESPWDSQITIALGAVGRLRFALNQKEI